MTGRRTILTMATLAALAIVQPAAAQVAPAPHPAADRSADPIVVTGRASADAEKVRALARAITPRVWSDEPLARFSDPICFGTGGLSRPALEAIGARLAENAVAAGVPLAGGGCKVNVLLLFVGDGRAELKDLLKRRSWLFGGLEPNAIRAVIDEPGPAHVWTTSEVRSRDGDRPFVDANGIRTLRVPIASHIVLPVRRDMLTSIILIDRAAVIGRSLNQIADHAAMRTLAMVRPKGATGGDTILTLFDPGTATPPTGMTAFDRSYLKALYAGAGNQRSTTKLGLIAQQIVKDAAAGPAAPGR